MADDSDPSRRRRLPPPDMWLDDETVPSRDRISSLEVRLAGMRPLFDAIAQRVSLLENKGADMWQTLATLETGMAVQTKMLEQLTAARAEDSNRTRTLFGVIVPLISVGVAIIALVTR